MNEMSLNRNEIRTTSFLVFHMFFPSQWNEVVTNPLFVSPELKRSSLWSLLQLGLIAIVFTEFDAPYH